MVKLILAITLLLAQFGALAQGPPQIGAVGFVSGVNMSVQPNAVAIGLTAQGTAIAIVGGTSNVDVTKTGTWTSANPAIATVSNAGLVKGVSAGTTTISISSGGYTPSVQFTVGVAPLIQTTGMTGCPASCALPGGTGSVGYSYTFGATGGTPPYTWSIDASTSSCLSGSGLTFSSGGLLAATAAVTGTYTCLFDVTDAQPVTTSLSVSVTIAATGSCGPPNFCAFTGNDVLGQGAAPNLSATSCASGPLAGKPAVCNNGASVTDPTYVTAGLPSGSSSPVTRCTDGQSAVNFPLATFTSGQGGSGVTISNNTTSTIARVSDTNSHGFMTLTQSGHCVAPSGVPTGSIFITQALNSVTAGSNTVTEDFGSGNFDLTNANLWWSFGNNSDISSPLWVVPYTINATTGAFSYPNGATCGLPSGNPCPTVDFQYGLPLGNNAPPWSANTTYPFGAYVSAFLASVPGLGGSLGGLQVRQWQPNCGNTTCPSGEKGFAIGDIIVPCRIFGGDPNCTASPALGTNPQQCMFKLIAVGVTGAAEPNWGTKNPCANSTVVDGTSKWRGINTTITQGFVFQNVGSTGLSGSTNPVWVTPGDGTTAVPGHPNLTSTVTDGTHGVVWMNVGPNYVPFGAGNVWQAWAGTSSDNHKFSDMFSTNSYGGSPCGKVVAGIPDCYSNMNNDQGTGIWALEANTSDPVTGKPTFYLLNTATGIQTNWTCPGSTTLGTCVGAVPATWGTKPFNSIIAEDGISLNCNFFIHNGKNTTDGMAITVTQQVNITNVTPCANVQAFSEWLPMSSFDANKNLQIFSDGLNHWGTGHNVICPFHNGGYGATSGVMIPCFPATNVSGNQGGLPPGCSTSCLTGGSGTFSRPPYTFSVANHCGIDQNTLNGGYPSNGIALNVFGKMTSGFTCPSGKSCNNLPACNIASAYDMHPSLAYNPGFTDTGFACGTVYNLATLSTLAFSDYQGEEICFSAGFGGSITTFPATNTGFAYRFAHNWNTNTSHAFSTQFAISQMFQDGTGMMFSSDWNCTLGAVGPQSGSNTGTGVPVQDSSGQLGHLPVASVPSAAQNFCGQVWDPGFTYSAGQMINPLQGTTGGGSIYDVFQAITVNGPTSLCTTATGGVCGTPLPTWKSCTATLLTGCSFGPTATSTVTSASVTAGVATVLSTLQPPVGSFVTIAGNTTGTYNATWMITASTSTQFQFALASAASGTGGTAYVRGSQFCDSQTSSDTLPSCTHGTIWQDVGVNNQRGDVFFVTLK